MLPCVNCIVVITCSKGPPLAGPPPTDQAELHPDEILEAKLRSVFTLEDLNFNFNYLAPADETKYDSSSSSDNSSDSDTSDEGTDGGSSTENSEEASTDGEESSGEEEGVPDSPLRTKVSQALLESLRGRSLARTLSESHMRSECVYV